MAAKSRNPFLCCLGSGGSGAGDNNDDCASRRRITGRRKGSLRSSLRMSFTSLSLSGTLLLEDLSLVRSGSNLHAFTYAELRAVTANFSHSNYLDCGRFGLVYNGTVDDKLYLGLAVQAVTVNCLDLV